MPPTPSRDMDAELEALDARLNELLPPRYQHCYAEVSPNSMGSAKLKYDEYGRVAWGEIWTTFCDLALAGGPPHRGTLLEPPPAEATRAEPVRHSQALAEIDRALGLATGAATLPGYAPGWIGVPCAAEDEATWLQFAVTAENVSARRRGRTLQLPAGPDFRPEKEIKNLVVALAKSLHYWDGHLTDTQQRFAEHEAWEPATAAEAAADPERYAAAEAAIEEGFRAVGLPTSPRRYPGWIGVETADEEAAVWLLRAVLVERILARREDNVLYLPVEAAADAERGARIAGVFRDAWELWQAHSRRPAWRPSGRRD
jgi:sirohydrochlorin cobaltochelatase